MSCQPAHCAFCFDVLSARLNSSDPPSVKDLPLSEQSFPLFVTWNIKSSSASASWENTKLRGCIGNFSPMPLEKGLRDYALISALKDTRFSPISLSDLPKLECGVSLLTNFEPCSNSYDWELGKHGIHVHIPTTDSRGTRELSATFLPDVAPQQGWNQRETLENAIRKAGYRAKIDEKLIDTLRVDRYQSSKYSMNYDEWKAAQ